MKFSQNILNSNNNKLSAHEDLRDIPDINSNNKCKSEHLENIKIHSGKSNHQNSGPQIQSFNKPHSNPISGSNGLISGSNLLDQFNLQQQHKRKHGSSFSENNDGKLSIMSNSDEHNRSLIVEAQGKSLLGHSLSSNNDHKEEIVRLNEKIHHSFQNQLTNLAGPSGNNQYQRPSSALNILDQRNNNPLNSNYNSDTEINNANNPAQLNHLKYQTQMQQQISPLPVLNGNPNPVDKRWLHNAVANDRISRHNSEPNVEQARLRLQQISQQNQQMQQQLAMNQSPNDLTGMNPASLHQVQQYKIRQEILNEHQRMAQKDMMNGNPHLRMGQTNNLGEHNSNLIAELLHKRAELQNSMQGGSNQNNLNGNVDSLMTNGKGQRPDIYICPVPGCGKTFRRKAYWFWRIWILA